MVQIAKTQINSAKMIHQIQDVAQGTLFVKKAVARLPGLGSKLMAIIDERSRTSLDYSQDFVNKIQKLPLYSNTPLQ